MAATNGLEKFSHLEDKIYRTIELTKALRQEKDDLERQLASARNQPEAMKSWWCKSIICWLSATRFA